MTRRLVITLLFVLPVMLISKMKDTTSGRIVWIFGMALCICYGIYNGNPDSKVNGANMRPIWGRQDPAGPHVGPMNLVNWVALLLEWITWCMSLSICIYFSISSHAFLNTKFIKPRVFNLSGNRIITGNNDKQMCIGAVDLHPSKAGVWICFEFVSSVLVMHSWALTRKLLSNQKRITDTKQCQHPDKSLSQLMLRLRQNYVNLQTIFSNWFLPHNCYSHKFLRVLF